MSSFLNARGEVQQLPIVLTMYREAAERGQSLAGYLNSQYQTDAERYGSVFEQVLASEGIFVRPNREFGIRPSTLADIMDGPRQEAGTLVKDATPTSRILYPAVIMQALEDKLVSNLTMNPAAFDELVGYEESINGDRYEQPIISMAGAEKGRSQGIAQLAQPASMLSITTSDKAYRIPTYSIGLEVSDQALKSTTLDFVAMTLSRQAAVERNERADNYILALLNGDVDNADGSLASLGLMDNASSFDPAATGGTMTHVAWIKYLMKNGKKRTITHLVTDFDTAQKIETRTGKPEINRDDSKTSRIDTQFEIMNPTWAKNPRVFLTDNAAWPAGTIMGLDKQWAVRRVRNLGADYNGIESYVMRRSTALRIDFGEHVNRLYNEAFGGLVLA